METSKVSKLISLFPVFMCLCFVVCSANAHESLDARIQHLDTQLDGLPSDKSNNSVMLMLRRADLYRRQSDWDAALHDYQHVAETDPQNIGMMFGRAQLHLDQRRYLESLEWSARVLNLQPEHALAELLYARALVGIGQFDDASDAFEHAIERLAKPRPEHYIEHAQSLLENNRNQHARSRAIAVLDKGAQVLGDPISLHSLSVELERNSGQLDAALSRIDKVLARNGSLLNWRLRRSELLIELERHSQALIELHCVMQNIHQLPEQRRHSHAFQTLMQRSQNLVAQIKGKSTTTAKPDEVSFVSGC